MILITGATGHSGSYFVKKLSEAGYSEPIKCIVRENSDISLLESSGLSIAYCRGMLEDVSFVEECMAGVDTVFHFASIHYSETITQAALKNNVKLAVYVHTTGRFSKFKAAAEDYIRIEDWVISSGIDYIILRPTMIYGSKKDRNMYKLADYLYKHKFFPVFGRGDNLMQPIHAKDVGVSVYKAYIAREKTINKCYNVSGKHPISYIVLLRTVARALNKRVIFLHIPYSLSLAGAYAYNCLFKNAAISVEQVMRMNEDKAFEYVDAENDFGFCPMAFEEGIADEAAQYLREAPAKHRGDKEGRGDQ